MKTTASNLAKTAKHHVQNAVQPLSVDQLLDVIVQSLDDSQADDVVSGDIRQKSALGDYIVIASGRSGRHTAAIGDHLVRSLKEHGVKQIQVEGLEAGDWILVDAGDIIVHLFRTEMRAFYNIEKMWLNAPDNTDAAALKRVR